MRRSIFVDTSAWYAAAARQDSQHHRVASCFAALLDSGARLFTSDFVLDETLTRLRYDTSYAEALAFWQTVQQAQCAGFLRVLRADEGVWADAMVIFERYSDQKLSFTDCTSFAVARGQGIGEALTLDHHFALFGLTLLPGLG